MLKCSEGMEEGNTKKDQKLIEDSKEDGATLVNSDSDEDRTLVDSDEDESDGDESDGDREGDGDGVGDGEADNLNHSSK
jgi:hypothetical protein